MLPILIAALKALVSDEQIVSIVKGALVAVAGAFLTVLLASLQALPQTGWVPLAVAALSVLANVIRKFAANVVEAAKAA